MIKCSECGKDISDTAPACVGCGAPIKISSAKKDSSSIFDLNNFKSALSTIATKVKETAEIATEQGKELIKTKQQKDNEAIEQLRKEFGETHQHAETEDNHNRTRFQSALDSTIDIKFAEIIKTKPEKENFLNFIDSQIMTASVRNVFKNALGAVPPQIEAACKLSEAILAPSALEREQLIKSAVGIGGGAAGVGMIIAGVGGALGWGAGVIASVSAFFVGTSLAGPAGWAIAGITLAGIAAYFATTSNQMKDTERFLNVLKSSCSRAVEAIWPEHQGALIRVLDNESTT